MARFPGRRLFSAASGLEVECRKWISEYENRLLPENADHYDIAQQVVMSDRLRQLRDAADCLDEAAALLFRVS